MRLGGYALVLWLLVGALTFCRPIVEAPPLPHEIAPVLVPGEGDE